MLKKLWEGQPLFLVDIDEVAYDFTKNPTLRVKFKGGKIIERERACTNSETRAWSCGYSLTAEEFEKY